MKIIVTGATGYLGSRLCHRLSCLGHRVIASGRSIERKPECDSFVVSDLESLNQQCSKIKHVDALIHCAALSASWGKKSDFFYHNVSGTKSMLELCRNLEIPRMIHISSPSLLARLSDQENLKESDLPPEIFLNDYAESKWAAEQRVKEATGFERVILRPQAIIGAGDTTLLPRLIETNLNSGIPIFPHRNPVIDVTHVENVIGSIVASLDVKATRSEVEVYHITNGEPRALLDLLGDFFRRIDMELRTKKISYPLAKIVATWSKHVARVLGVNEPRLTPYTLSILAHTRTLDITKAREKLGYQPEISLDQALDDCAESWLKRPIE